MSKSLLLSILPITLLACADHSHTIIIESPCGKMDIGTESNEDYQSNETDDPTPQEQTNDTEDQVLDEGEQQYLGEEQQQQHLDEEQINSDEEELLFEEEEEEEGELLFEEEEEEELLFEEEEEEELLFEEEEEEEEELLFEEDDSIIEESPERTETTNHDLQLLITADDHWEAWINGEYVGQNSNFTVLSELHLELPPGSHTLAIKVKDIGYVINGLIASVDIDDKSYSVTGDGQWLASKNEPSSQWQLAEYNDDSWNPAEICTASDLWSGQAESMLQQGGAWIWHNSDCQKHIGSSWFRLNIIIE